VAVAQVQVETDPDVISAWDAYKEATRGQSGVRYAEVEPWAWARLQTELRQIRAARRNSGK
jgi:hypothetical protein